MGLGFGEMYKGLRIIMIVLSPYELKAFSTPAKVIPKIVRRTCEEFFYVVPPLALGYLTFYTCTKRHRNNLRKKPGQFDNDV